MSIDLAADRAIIAAATPGPWVHEDDAAVYANVGAVLVADCGAGDQFDPGVLADANLIAAARTRWSAALDELEEAREHKNNTLKTLTLAQDERDALKAEVTQLERAYELGDIKFRKAVAEVERLTSYIEGWKNLWGSASNAAHIAREYIKDNPEVLRCFDHAMYESGRQDPFAEYKAENALLRAVVDAARSVATEPDVHDLLACYIKGNELFEHIAAIDAARGVP